MTFLRTALPLLAALAIPALAQAQEAPRPELLNRLTDCRAMTDPAARLSCYDTAVEALDAAERQGEVVVVDRAQVRESRRALFGFEMPSLPAFGRVTAAEDEVSSVETTLTRASRGGDGNGCSAWPTAPHGARSIRNRCSFPTARGPRCGCAGRPWAAS
ncbi:hypothetical protein [Brevundimonas denitrificans]|uniref:hypothetical protein n=1 Tax=Brevundimonas denitrificans TaxID=1443434 RepID=UPI00223C0073|nr:hypothetical protein [Brevundimonas denitrificans]